MTAPQFSGSSGECGLTINQKFHVFWSPERRDVIGASLIGSPPALMKNDKNERARLGLKLDVQGNKGPLFDRPPWVPLGSLPLTYVYLHHHVVNGPRGCDLPTLSASIKCCFAGSSNLSLESKVISIRKVRQWSSRIHRFTSVTSVQYYNGVYDAELLT